MFFYGGLFLIECPCAVSRFYSRCTATISPANTMDTILVSFMRMLMDGPEVSLNGSPTVSPMTAALCSSLPFPPSCPLSMYFFALSQAPPAFAIITASTNPVTVLPASSPDTPSGPRRSPTATGMMTATMAGATISLWAEMVHISTQAP